MATETEATDNVETVNPAERNFLVRNISHLRGNEFGVRSKVAIIFLPGTQRRLVPGRDVLVSESGIREYPREYKMMCEQTAIQILTTEHQVLPYSYFEQEITQLEIPVRVSAPQPKPILDSAANDDNPQGPMASSLDQPIPPQEFTMPLPTHPAALDHPDFQKEEEEKQQKEAAELAKMEQEIAALEAEESAKKKADAEQSKKKEQGKGKGK